ncbi:protein translocase subunit SecF [Mycolicibacterium brumae]|uniref:protein translocase subunit SecF n=1 Tax=Mycolicibacterium brumae TaxID=85968 RepID=UPI003521B74C
MTETDDGEAEETAAVAVKTTTKPAKRGKDKPAAAAPQQRSFLNRLYTGTGGFDVIGKRKMWYMISAVMLLITIASILVRGFTFGIDFEGGTKVSIPAPESSSVTTEAAEEVFSRTLGFAPESVVEVGSGDSKTVQIRTETLDNDQTTDLTIALFDEFQPLGPDGQPSQQAVSSSDVSPTWGGQITQKMLIALVVFVALVSIYITVRYERYMALSALITMFFDLIITAGVYSLVGFEVTPATVIGLLTILGFSLYDTVIVFDKVEENTEGFEHTTRRTYAEQANLAVNQTFMRSINTSVISALPILALMVIAVWLLGVGTLQDLALIQLVGVIVGTYSSIFVATPLLVSMLERTEKVRNHTRRVLKRRARADKAAESADAEAADESDDTSAEPTAAAAPAKATAGAPSRPSRPTGKRSARRS